MGYGRLEPDVEGEWTLGYALAFNLLLGNTCFKKPDSHLITYKSRNLAVQIDFILFHRTMGKLVTNVKMIPSKRLSDKRSFPGGLQLACECACSCSWCCHWGYLEQHQDWLAQGKWRDMWHNSAPPLASWILVVEWAHGKGHCCQLESF